MSCHICGRGSCASWMHSLEEQEKYAPAIELFEKAEELRECMTEIAGYELPKNWADEALAAYKEAQHG